MQRRSANQPFFRAVLQNEGVRSLLFHLRYMFNKCKILEVEVLAFIEHVPEKKQTCRDQFINTHVSFFRLLCVEGFRPSTAVRRRPQRTKHSCTFHLSNRSVVDFTSLLASITVCSLIRNDSYQFCETVATKFGKAVCLSIECEIFGDSGKRHILPI